MAHAHYLVHKAVKSGTLVRPSACDDCGASPTPNKRGAVQIQAHHHNGYENPLDVQWLCPKCHNEANGSASEVHPKETDPLGSILS